jgi:hypothetical protein
MAVNYHRPHLVVLSEDDATRSLAVGFSDQVPGPMEIRKPAGGWPSVLHEFEHHYLAHLKRYADAHLLMVIDFDLDFAGRLAYFKSKIPPQVVDRVYILGAEDEAETLKRQQKMHLGPMGAQLAEECRDQKHEHWVCPQLAHNQPEVARLNANVRSFLFKA